MNYKINFPQHINADISLPASKSISNRVLIIDALCDRKCDISNVSKCDDTYAMLSALASESDIINIGAAGTAMRFLTGFFSMKSGKTLILDGSERMRHRPIKTLVDALEKCGAKIEYAGETGYPPLRIIGKNLKAPEELSIPGNISSQYISSLLMIAPTMADGMRLTLSGEIMSTPYIDMTLSIMNRFGINGYRNDNKITIPPGNYIPTSFTVESDWSAASYWYEIAALIPGCKIILNGLHPESVQGDSVVHKIFDEIGVSSTFSDNTVTLTHNGKSTDFLDINLAKQPDLAQTIVVTAAMLGIPFKIGGLKTLKIKETDRIEALCTELHKFGIFLDVTDDFSLCWNGSIKSRSENIAVNTYDDHRMAMAFAPAAIIHPDITINDIDVVTKSYPEFWNHLSHCGVILSEV